MVRKKLASAVMALSALQAGLVAAMGLGELSLNSALNQPFKAEIRLLKVEDLDPSQIIVRLAPTDDFKRAGIERDFFLTELRFNVELDGRGGGVIKITTREPVIEPYLDFLIEARWPSGRLLRAYTVLLDLPTYADSAPAPVAPASSAALNRGVSASSAPAKKPAPVADSSPRRAPSTAMPPATGDREYRVQHSDTMWEIAAANRPGNAVTVQQTMLAIQRLNPQAFINNNINLVKSGYVLRLPSEADINVDNGTAVQEVAAQNRAWRGGSSAGQAAEVDGPQLDTRSGAESDAGGVSDKGRLSIAAAGESTASRAGDSSGSAAGNAALRDQLASAQENLDRAQRENDEMLSRLDEMERQVATLQRLLTLKEEQLAALQENLAADPASEQAADLAPAAAGETTDFNYAGPSETAADEVQEAQAAAPEPAPKPVAAQPVQPEPGLVARIVDNPLYLGGIGAGVLALVAGGIWLARRRKDDEDLAAVAELNADSDDLAEELEDLDADALAIADEGLSQVEDAELAEPEPEVATPDAPVRAETGDVIAEAEIYVAYGRCQQAIDLLKTA
ncbi:MAG TPA: FimV/HubP family polar landmark protein, partial [Spongiibacteraceae bacterium]|nr:FimV/HubP family polar landmark protein [Spongiibacteraceae bacterium]